MEGYLVIAATYNVHFNVDVMRVKPLPQPFASYDDGCWLAKELHPFFVLAFWRPLVGNKS